MIRINLLGVERQRVRKSAAVFDAALRTKLACGLVMGLAMAGVGAWYWSLSSEASRLDADLMAARRETTRLRGVLDEVKRAEDRRANLQQRVAVIQDLRDGQAVPVQLLDHVSHSVPDMLWLTALDQKGDAVQIEGRTTTLISLADFVGNLGTNRLVTKPIDIVNSEVEASSSQAKNAVDLIKFSVKAPLTPKAPPAGHVADSTVKGAAGRGAQPPAAGARPSAH